MTSTRVAIVFVAVPRKRNSSSVRRCRRSLLVAVIDVDRCRDSAWCGAVGSMIDLVTEPESGARPIACEFAEVLFRTSYSTNAAAAD